HDHNLQLRKILERAAQDELGNGRASVELARNRALDQARAAVAAVARAYVVAQSAATRVKADWHVEPLQFGPQRVVEVVGQQIAVDGRARHGGADGAQLLNAAACFLRGQIGILPGNPGPELEAPRVAARELSRPVV